MMKTNAFIASLIALGVGLTPAPCRAHARFRYSFDAMPHDLPEFFFEQGPELQIGDIFESVLRASSAHPIVLDVGANAGYFTLLAASLGASVYAFELQPTCVGHIRQRLDANAGLGSRVHLFQMGLGDPAVVAAPTGACDGGFGYSGLSQVKHARAVPRARTRELDPRPAAGVAPGHATSVITPASTVVQDGWTLDLVKIDTEGGEVGVLKHMLPLVDQKRVKHIVVEILPAHWELRGGSFEEGVALFERLHQASRSTIVLDDPTSFDGGVAKRGGGIKGLPTHDLTSVRDFLAERARKSAGCNVWFSF